MPRSQHLYILTLVCVNFWTFLQLLNFNQETGKQWNYHDSWPAQSSGVPTQELAAPSAGLHPRGPPGNACGCPGLVPVTAHRARRSSLWVHWLLGVPPASSSPSSRKRLADLEAPAPARGRPTPHTPECRTQAGSEVPAALHTPLVLWAGQEARIIPE